MITRIASMPCRPLVLAVVCALLMPGAAWAETKKEKQLEARVSQLEAQVQALLNAQQQQSAQITQTQNQVAQTQSQVSDTQTRLDQVKAAAPAAAPQFVTAPGMTVAFHGFINASAFSQSSSFGYGNGQNAQWSLPGSHGNLSGIDIRNTRFWLDLTGAHLGQNWTGGGHLELDFFGGNNGTGSYSGQQPMPRLRQAYVDLDNASTGTKIRIGQQYVLMFPLDNVPDSVTHVAFPLGFGAGLPGWRYPGVVVMQDLNYGSAGPQWRLDMGVYSNSWSGPGSTVNFQTAGNVGFHPQLEARLHVAGNNWLAYLTGHYAQMDLSGVEGDVATPIKSKIKSEGVELGGLARPGPWSLKGLIYTGKGLGEIYTAMAQFGDISETGGYAQVGYNFTKHWGMFATYTTDKLDKNDVITWLNYGSTGYLRNRQGALSVIYTDGPYKFGLEAVHDKLDFTDGVTTSSKSGNQVSLSAQYTF